MINNNNINKVIFRLNFVNIIYFICILLPISTYSSSNQDMGERLKDLKNTLNSYPKEECLENFDNISKNGLFGTINSFEYYNKRSEIQNIKDFRPFITNVYDILKWTSCISLNLMNDRLNNQEMYKLLEDIIILRERLRNEQNIGSINFLLDNVLSTLSSGIIFNLASKDEKEELNKISDIVRKNTQTKKYSLEKVINLLKNETGYSKESKNKSLNEYLVEMINEKYKNETQKSNNKDNISPIKTNDIILLNITNRDPNSRKSQNPLISFNELEFASDYFSVRKLEFLTMFIYDYKFTSNEIMDRKELSIKIRDKIAKKLKKEIKEEYYNADIDGSIDDMTTEIENGITQNLNNRGKRIILTVYRKCAMMISDL